MATNLIRQETRPATNNNLIRQPKDISKTRGIFRSLGQGTTFGFADEIVAGIVASIAAATGDDFADVYREVVLSEREGLREFEETSPGTALASEVAGGLTTGAGLARGVKTAGGALLEAAAGGALFETGKAEILEDIPGQALKGATLGAGTFGAFRGIGAGVRRAANTRAGRVIGNAIQRTQKTSDEMADELKRLGPDARLADVVPELTEEIAQIPGARQVLDDFLEVRAGGQQQRILSALSGLTKNTKSYWDNIFQLDAKRQIDAKPLYDQAYNMGVSFNDELSQTVGKLKKAFPSAWRSARKLAGLEGEALPEKIPESMTLKQLDFFKRGVDTEIESTFRSRPSIARAGRKVKNELLDELDQQNPIYKQAREAWAGPSSLIDAQEKGRKILTTDFELTAKDVAKLTQGEKEAFVIGAVRAVRDKIINTRPGNNATLAFRPLLRERLRPIFPDDDSFNSFLNVLDSEDTFTIVRNQALKGSPTAKRQIGIEDVAAPLATAARAGVGPAIADMVRKMLTSRKRLTEGTATEIAEILVSEGVDIKQVRNMLSGKVPTSVLNKISVALSVGTEAGVIE